MGSWDANDRQKRPHVIEQPTRAIFTGRSSGRTPFRPTISFVISSPSAARGFPHGSSGRDAQVEKNYFGGNHGKGNKKHGTGDGVIWVSFFITLCVTSAWSARNMNNAEEACHAQLARSLFTALILCYLTSPARGDRWGGA